MLLARASASTSASGANARSAGARGDVVVVSGHMYVIGDVVVNGDVVVLIGDKL